MNINPSCYSNLGDDFPNINFINFYETSMIRTESNHIYMLTKLKQIKFQFRMCGGGTFRLKNLE